MPTQRRLPGCRPGGGAGRQQGQGALSFHHARRGGGFRLLPPRARGGARLPREKLVFRSIQMVQCGAPPCLPGERACNQIGAGVPSPLFRRSRESGNLGISVTCPLFMPGAGSGPTLSRGRRIWVCVELDHRLLRRCDKIFCIVAPSPDESYE